MKNSVVINNHEVGIKEYKGERVVTFKDIDTVHERPEGTAGRNFRQHRDKLIEGVDYFEVFKKDVPTIFVETYEFSKFAPSGILITESGYLMIVKSLTDDLAWQVQRELVNTYFRAKEIQTAYSDLSALSPELQMAAQLLQGMINNELKMKEYEQKQREHEKRQVKLENALYRQSKNINMLNGIVNVEENASPRQLFTKSVQKLAYLRQEPFGSTYKEIYGIINTNLRMNIQLRARNRGIRPIDVLEQEDLLEYGLRIVNDLIEKEELKEAQ